MFRITTRHLIHGCFVDVFKGRVNDKETWTPLGGFNGRLVPRSSMTNSGQAQAQDFDSQVILGMPGSPEGQPAFERTKRYRVRVVEYKTANEVGDGARERTELEVKRSWYLEVVDASTLADNAGTDFLATLSCRNAKEWAPTPG